MKIIQFFDDLISRNACLKLGSFSDTSWSRVRDSAPLGGRVRVSDASHDISPGNDNEEVQSRRVKGQGHQNVLYEEKFGVRLKIILCQKYGCNFIVFALPNKSLSFGDGESNKYCIYAISFKPGKCDHIMEKKE